MFNVRSSSGSGDRDAAVLTWIHDFAPFGVITTDRQFNVQTWNRWMEVHSGKPAASVLGQNLFALFPELGERSLAPRFARALAGEVSVLSAALHGHLLRLEPSVREGGFAQMQQTARIAPLHSEGEIVGTIVLIEDVTERELRALVLRRQHRRDHVLSWASAHLLECSEPDRSVRDLFFKIAEQFDVDGYLLYLAEPGSRLLKLHASGGIASDRKELCELQGSAGPPANILVGPERPCALEGLSTAGGEPGEFHQRLGFRACGVVPLLAGETRLGVLCIGTRSRDRLEEGELELLGTIGQYLAVALAKEEASRQLHAAQTKLNQHAQELERQVQERTAKLRETISELETFSYSVAHDLRAPIRALVGYCEVLKEDYASALPKDASGVIGRLDIACRKLDEVTRDLLELTRVSRQEIHLCPIQLELVVADVLSLPSSPIDCILIRRPLHCVLGHRTLLRQCLANLVDNSAKFVQEGRRPRITIWSEEVSRHGAGDGAHVAPSPTQGAERHVVRIIVQDEGIGIAPEAHKKIFGIFERATSSTAYGGSGIGLAIVARAVHRMGGSCGVESQPGAGSRFWIELPGAAPESAR